MRTATVHREVVRLTLVATLVLVTGATGVPHAQASPLSPASAGPTAGDVYSSTPPGQGPTTPPIVPDPGNIIAQALLSLSFDQKIEPVPGTTQWIYKVTNGRSMTAYNIAFKYTYQDTHTGSPVPWSGTFTIAKVAGYATLDVAVTCKQPIAYCKNSTLEILPGNYQIAGVFGKASAP